LLIRKHYLTKLKSYKDIALIKVLVGIRKCGKTTILLQYISLLKEENKENNIIFIDLNDFKTSLKIYDLISLDQYISECYDINKKNYLFIDEVQQIKDFQIIVNNWINKPNIDIYITGSNSKLLSNEISTLITGKNVIINIYPLAFSELCNNNIS
jgi:predicted AAA+ superfamily ATPase